MTEYELRIGNRSTGISVIPDATYPGMFRIKDRDGRLSDLLNLSRAKDAALSWASSRGTGIGSQHLEWRITDSPPELPALRNQEAA